MNFLTRLLACGGLVFMLSSCSTAQLKLYANNQPRLDLPSFFNGKLEANGLVKNRAGEVTRYFNAEINAYWRDGVGTLEERFVFNDGEIQYRTWTLKPNGQGYDASAGDVVGIGKARLSGNALHMNYQLQINYKGSPITLSVEDWMWLVDNNTLLNESQLRKWGLRVGSVQLVINKLD